MDAEEGIAASTLDSLLRAMAIRGTQRTSMLLRSSNRVIGIGSCEHPNETGPAHQDSQLVRFDRSWNGVLQPGPEDGDWARSLGKMLDSPGSFSFLAAFKGRVIAGRDRLGQKPLYYGYDERGNLAIASLLASLRQIGVRHPIAVPAGQSISFNGDSAIEGSVLALPDEAKLSEQEAVLRLGELLLEASARTLPESSAIAFSGGIDSTLVAEAVRKNGAHPELLTVGLRGQPELEHSRRIARKIGLRVTVRELSETDVLTALPEVVNIVESCDPVIVGVSIPLYFACEMAMEMGMKTLGAGQLSDELFCGYGRFEELGLRNELAEARKESFRSVQAAPTSDFEPGDKLAVSHRLELRCPFAYLPLVLYSMKIPIQLKLKLAGGKVTRKYILRRLANEWRLPEEVVSRPKKAVQYSSGVQKVLLKEARRRVLTLQSFIESFATRS